MKSNISTASRPGSSSGSYTFQWYEPFFLILRSDSWKSAIGTIREWFFLRRIRSATRPYEFLRQTRSQSVSLTPREPDLDTSEFPKQDIMAAKVVVKRLIGLGLRPDPTSGILTLPAYVVEEAMNREAVKFLKEQQAARRQPVAIIN